MRIICEDSADDYGRIINALYNKLLPVIKDTTEMYIQSNRIEHRIEFRYKASKTKYKHSTLQIQFGQGEVKVIYLNNPSIFPHNFVVIDRFKKDISEINDEDINHLFDRIISTKYIPSSVLNK